jgi:hypothetical protein
VIGRGVHICEGEGQVGGGRGEVGGQAKGAVDGGSEREHIWVPSRDDATTRADRVDGF